MRDDELVAEQVQAGEGLLDRDLDALTGEGLAVEDERAVLPLRPAKELARRIHTGLGTALGAPDSVELGLVLGAAALHKGLAVGSELDPLGPKPVRELDRERGRHDGALDAELLDGAHRSPEPDLLHRNPLLNQVVPAELLERVRLKAVVALYALDLERRDHDVALACMLEVEECIGDRHGDLVAHLRGANGVRPDQDICHGGGCYRSPNPYVDSREWTRR